MLELREPDFEPLRVGTVLDSPWLKDRRTVESLEPSTKHWSISLIEQTPSDVDHSSWVYPNQIAVIGEVMDCTERDPIHDRGHACGVEITDDV